MAGSATVSDRRFDAGSGGPVAATRWSPVQI